MAGAARTTTWEWPTIGVLVANGVALAALVTWHGSLPTAAVLAGLVAVGTLHMSLVHEVLHGHPTPHQWLNEAMILVPSFLWLPYVDYRDSHRLHHRVALTVPGADPESFYVTRDAWDRANPLWRAMLRANRTLLWRVLVWPAVGMARGLRSLLAGLASGGRRTVTVFVHLAASALTLWLVSGVGGLPWWQYVLGFAYGGLGVTYLRSFAEHLPVTEGSASAVVRSNRVMGTLFLNNNLHHAHHAQPDVAWFRLPALAEDLGSDAAAAAGAGWYRGYAELLRRYAVRPFSQPVHPTAS